MKFSLIKVCILFFFSISLTAMELAHIPDTLENSCKKLILLKLKSTPYPLRDIQYLNLSADETGKRIKNVSNNIKKLLTISEADLGKAQATELLTNQPLFNLVKLKNLNLSGNKIETLPTEFAQLTSLQKITLSHNRLKRIPDALIYLTGLKRLCLQHNEIELLPPAINQLTKLKCLILRGNPLKTLPETIIQLTTLEDLSLGIPKPRKYTYEPTEYEHEFSSLPDTIEKLPNLCEESRQEIESIKKSIPKKGSWFAFLV